MADEPLEATHATPPPERSRRGMSSGLVVGLLVGSLLGAGTMWLSRAREPAPEAAAPVKATVYTCPMHPTYTSPHPGDCPICGMALVLQEPAPGAEAARKVKFYRSPMNPEETSPEPRKDAMGMDYLPVYEEQLASQAADVGGYATVAIDADRQQLIGLRTTPVVRGKVAASWTTVGKVTVDETRVRHVNVKVGGYVERVFVDFVGRPVRRGERLFFMYSPELLSVQSEFLLAVRSREALRKAGAMTESADALVESARQRLLLWDIPASAIEALERTGVPTKTQTIHSPIAGAVTKKDVFEGHRLAAGDMPYEITDLSSVWVVADAYEADLGKLKTGLRASLVLHAYPDREFKGRVAFIDPVLDPRTRTVKVRLSFANPAGELRPELFGTVTLRTAPRQALVVPSDAIIDSGTMKVVFVSLGDGKFAPREVTTGDRDGDTREVLTGLEEGEEVIERANFLVDSESRLRASLSALGRR